MHKRAVTGSFFFAQENAGFFIFLSLNSYSLGIILKFLGIIPDLFVNTIDRGFSYVKM